MPPALATVKLSPKKIIPNKNETKGYVPAIDTTFEASPALRAL